MTHLETAHQIGVQKALENAGYKNAAELVADVQACGLDKTAEAVNDDVAIAALKAKLGG